jgi:hypothetical protein
MVSIERHPPNGGIEKKRVVLASLWYQLAMIWVLFHFCQFRHNLATVGKLCRGSGNSSPFIRFLIWDSSCGLISNKGHHRRSHSSSACCHCEQTSAHFAGRTTFAPASSFPVHTFQKSGSSDFGCRSLRRSLILTNSGSSDAHPRRMACWDGSEGNSRNKPLGLSGTKPCTSLWS